MFLKDWTVTDYGGISASRLEVLEERLKDDVLAELEAFGGRCVFVYPQFQILIHMTRNTMKVASSHRDLRWICDSYMGRSRAFERCSAQGHYGIP
jgi:hypothetical protein